MQVNDFEEEISPISSKCSSVIVILLSTGVFIKLSDFKIIAWIFCIIFSILPVEIIKPVNAAAYWWHAFSYSGFIPS